jgi:diguanylate cyclase
MSLLLINLLFGVLALGIGFVAGGFLMGDRRRGEAGGRTNENPDEALEKRMAMERALMASSRLRDLATGMASDVGQHSERMEKITADLQAISLAPADQGPAVMAALTDIVQANEQLQVRLAKAEQQIQTQAEEIKAHESEARTDCLTQLNNRRAFDDELARRVSEWQRKGNVVSLIIVDVDHFKKFNDTHGHQAGDEVLRQVAASLKASTREMDICCRYGGEEFAIVLPSTIATDSRMLAERVRVAIEKTLIKFEGKQLKVTASFGVTTAGDNETPERMLHRADEALYASKEAGRNCSHFHTGTECTPITNGQVAKQAAAKPAEKPVVTAVLDSLPNRTKFVEELRRRVAESNRSAMPLSVIALELCEYQRVSATEGAGVGQMMLDATAQFLTSTMREMDMVGRLDDTRFVLMLPCASEDESTAIGQRLTDALAKCKLPIGKGVNLSCRTSNTALQPDDSAASLMARAEEGLREAAASLAF